MCQGPYVCLHNCADMCTLKNNFCNQIGRMAVIAPGTNLANNCLTGTKCRSTFKSLGNNIHSPCSPARKYPAGGAARQEKRLNFKTVFTGKVRLAFAAAVLLLAAGGGWYYLRGSKVETTYRTAKAER